ALQDLIQVMQDSGIQGFVHELAKLTFYVPVDYGAGGALDAGTSSTEFFSQLLTDLGLGSLLSL
ncbi:MAG: hypothetical protein ACRDTN_16890, partial [Mycobacterium sp.]